MIRILIAIIFVIVFLILSLPILLVEWIVGKFNPSSRDKIAFLIIRWAFRVVLVVAGTHINVTGAENIPEDRPVLFVGNHRSIFDILIVYSKLKTPTGIISKEELKKVPIFNIWMKLIGCYFLKRDDIKDGLKMVLYAIEKVKDGQSVLIFPEGTRNKGEVDMLPFRGGSFKIAEKSKCDIIPLTIVGSADIFENHKPFLKKTNIELVVGNPISVKDLPKEEMKLIPEKAYNIVLKAYKEKVGNI